MKSWAQAGLLKDANARKILETASVLQFRVMPDLCFVSELISEMSDYVEAVTSCRRQKCIDGNVTRKKQQ
jgi:hypothetical protein